MAFEHAEKFTSQRVKEDKLSAILYHRVGYRSPTSKTCRVHVRNTGFITINPGAKAHLLPKLAV